MEISCACHQSPSALFTICERHTSAQYHHGGAQTSPRTHPHLIALTECQVVGRTCIVVVEGYVCIWTIDNRGLSGRGGQRLLMVEGTRTRSLLWWRKLLLLVLLRIPLVNSISGAVISDNLLLAAKPYLVGIRVVHLLL